MANSIGVMMMRLMFFFGNPHALNREQGVLRAAVSFLANSGLLAPKIAVDGITLGHFVVAVALREIHAAAIRKLPQQGEDLPLDIGRWALGRVAEKDLVLDLQTAQLGVEYGQFLVERHRFSPASV